MLVEHINEIRIFKNILNLTACQKVLDVLGDTGRDASPFTEPLPDLHTVGCRLFLPSKVNGIHQYSTGVALWAERLTVTLFPYLVLDVSSRSFFSCFPQLLNVKADDPVVDIHVCPVVEHIQ